jgi:hypothetical protein
VSIPVNEYRTDKRLRVLFAIGLTQDFFATPQSQIRPIMEAIKTAFADLEGRFGVKVLGTMDDDETLVGATAGWPWTCYILAEAPDRDAVIAVCNELRVTSIDEETRVWKYLSIEARIGRPLFFAEQ